MVANIIGLVVECMKLMLVLCGVLNYKFKKSISGVIALSISILFLIVMGIKNNEYKISIEIIVVVFICALFVESEKRIVKWLLSLLSFFVICGIDDILSLIVKTFMNVSDTDAINNVEILAITNFFSLFIISVTAILLQHFYYKRKRAEKSFIDNSSIFYLILFILGISASSIYLTSFNTAIYKDTVKNTRMVALVVALFMIVFVVVGVLLIYNNNSKKYYKQVAEINNKLLKTQQNYYQLLQEKEKETRRFRHDISNHILCLDTLIKDGKYIDAEEYLENMRDSVSELKPKYQTGNMLVNAIINDIASRYNNVQLIWTGVVPENLKLSNMDLCTIFSNVLENAFQAADGCIEQGNVKVTARSLADSLTFSVENDFIEPVKESKGIFITKKEDKENHGFGTMNVRSCVHANGGSIEYNYDDKIFSVEIVLPNVVK